MHGIGRYNDILVASLYDDDGPEKNKLFLMKASSAAPGISVEWILEVFENEKILMKYMDFTE